MFRLERDNERPTRAEICIVRVAEGPCPGTERPQHPYGSRTRRLVSCTGCAGSSALLTGPETNYALRERFRPSSRRKERGAQCKVRRARCPRLTASPAEGLEVVRGRGERVRHTPD